MTIKEKMTEILSNESLADNEAKVNEIISSLGAFFVAKDQYNKKVGELDVALSNVKKLENEKLSADELKQKELNEILENAKKNERDFKLKTNRLEAIEIFKNAGLNETDYSDFVSEDSKSYIISDDLDKTKTLAQTFVNTLNSQKQMLEEKLRKEMQGNNPKPPAGDSNNDVMTKEKLNKMTYTEEIAFAQKNPELYSQLIEK